jgi:hypothetical protein
MVEFGKKHVKIKGLTPLLMNRLNPESLRKETKIRTTEYNTEIEAKNSAYITTIDEKEQLYIPNYAVYSMLVQASGLYKSGRISMRSLIAGTIRIEPEKILLGHCNYEIDERPVIIHGAHEARVLHARAKIPEWKAEFDIIYNKQVLSSEVVEKIRLILEDAGTRLGLLDYRPQHKGWFGTFTVEEFNNLE